MTLGSICDGIGRLADAIDAKDKQIAVLNLQLAESQAKASYCDLVLNCKEPVTISVIAKDYGYSAKQFNKLLHRLGEQFKQGDVWLLYQKYAVKGWTHTYTDARGIEHCKVHTYWTQKGRLDLYSLLKKHGYVPLIELGGAV